MNNLPQRSEVEVRVAQSTLARPSMIVRLFCDVLCTEYCEKVRERIVMRCLMSPRGNCVCAHSVSCVARAAARLPDWTQIQYGA